MDVSGIKNKMGILHFYSNSSYPKELTLNTTKSEKSSLAQTKNLILSNVSEDLRRVQKNLLFAEQHSFLLIVIMLSVILQLLAFIQLLVTIQP